MGRIYNRELKCGCLISSDGGGGLIPCCSENCDWDNWAKTKDYKLHLKEIEENV